MNSQDQVIGRPMEILLVEDGLLDARVTIASLKEGLTQHRLTLIRDGEEALEFLRQEGRFVRAPRPDLILLDLMLPKKTGTEILDELQADFTLKEIPVVIMTASDDEESREKCTALQVDAFIEKPVNVEKFLEVVKQLKRFWLNDVILPAID
jgi:two-component system, chemotaxis family, response regulator Rcp1